MTNSDKQALLAIARRELVRAVENGPQSTNVADGLPEETPPETPTWHAGAFVTLRTRGPAARLHRTNANVELGVAGWRGGGVLRESRGSERPALLRRASGGTGPDGDRNFSRFRGAGNSAGVDSRGRTRAERKPGPAARSAAAPCGHGVRLAGDALSGRNLRKGGARSERLERPGNENSGLHCRGVQRKRIRSSDGGSQPAGLRAIRVRRNRQRRSHAG